MIAGHHLEQVLRCRVLMREDEGSQAPAVRDAVIVTPLYIGRAALLPTFQDQRTDLPGRRLLRFQLRVNVKLGAIQDQRLDPAGLRPDLQAFRRVVREIIAKSFANSSFARRQVHSTRPRGA